VAELQLLGMTHYPPFGWQDDSMAGIMRMILADPGIPADAKDPTAWPTPMQAEWGDDEGRTSAEQHRGALIDGFDRIRAELDAFDPDLVLIWGDDQYENFHEDLIPPYAVLAYPDREIRPYDTRVAKAFPSYWSESPDTVITIKGRPDVARELTASLLEEGFDVPYAYRPAHDDQLPHAFLNTVLFLDHERTGFPWPIVCMPINCYGRKVVAAQGGWRPFGTELDLDPPSPPPWRLMDLGAAVARVLRASPWRVALIASSSWSHAFLTDHTWRLRPDTVADRALYEAMTARDFKRWEATTTADIEHAGQQEVLNWFALLGAARELGIEPTWSTFVETWVFNSNKVFAVWPPSS
jgi:Catalytic LigB subunit of aromatic ring-opening dioxygenase